MTKRLLTVQKYKNRIGAKCRIKVTNFFPQQLHQFSRHPETSNKVSGAHQSKWKMIYEGMGLS